MPRHIVPVVLLLVLAGAWAGSGVGAVPVPPTVSLPTVTVPLPPAPPLPITPPVPAPAPPTAVTVPPPLEPTPPPPIAQDEPPGATTQPLRPPAAEGSSSSPAHSLNRAQTPAKRKPSSTAPEKATTERHVAAPRTTPARIQGVSAAVQGSPPEDAGFGVFGPIGGALSVPAEVIPAALLAMAGLAVLLLGLAAAPLPTRASQTGATLVHMRGSIALTGMAALAMAIATYLLL